jgi:hypothetical protein
LPIPADRRGGVSKLKVRSCVIDGEAIVVDERGLSTFDLLRSWRHDHVASAPVYVPDNPNGQHHHRRPADSIAARRRIYDAAFEADRTMRFEGQRRGLRKIHCGDTQKRCSGGG